MVKGLSSLPSITQRLEGKVALITGGASGIGASAAKLFAKHGAMVVIADIQDDMGHALCKEIGCGDAVSFVHCDVTNEADVQNAVDTAVAKYGKLDIMYSNAGIEPNMDPRIQAMDLNEVKRVFDVNLYGAFLCAKHASRVMIPAKKGSILFTSSVASVTSGLTPHAYTVSKQALVGFTKNLCVELGEHGIRVNCISPSAVLTPLFLQIHGFSEKGQVEKLTSESIPLNGVTLEAEDVAEAALYLGSDESKYVTGLNLVLDGGYSTTNPAFGEALKKLHS